MSTQLELWPRKLRASEQEIKEVLNSFPVRLVLYHNQRVFLVEHENTGWYGLPGGKVEEWEEEGEFGNNLYDAGAVPTLLRELSEECGVNIKRITGEIKRLGIAEVVYINNTEKTAKHMTSSIFFAQLKDNVFTHQEILRSLVFFNSDRAYSYHLFDNHEYLHLLPDAAVAIRALRQGILAARYEQQDNFPSEWLTPKLIYFQMRPAPKPLFQAPDWLYA